MEETFGHFLASARADAVVTSRQLLPPKPSVKPSLIFFGPHQDGTAACFAEDVVVVTTITTAPASASASSAFPLFVLIPRVSLLLAVCLSGGRGTGEPARVQAAYEPAPVDGVEGDADCEGGRLDERAG